MDLSAFLTPSMAARAGMSMKQARAVLGAQLPASFYVARERRQARLSGALIVVGPLYPPRRKPKNVKR